jgi:hypothetical protein
MPPHATSARIVLGYRLGPDQHDWDAVVSADSGVAASTAREDA